MRKAGILLAVSSLPSRHGVGDFGPSSYRYIDLLKKCKIKIWQILPLNPVGFGNSPYQSCSSEAIDEIYVSLDELVEQGLIKKSPSFCEQSCKVDFAQVRAFKRPFLIEALNTFKPDEQYKKFQQLPWVQSYVLFRALKEKNDDLPWNEWSKEEKNKTQIDVDPFCVKYHLFIQYILYCQWQKLHCYATRNGIEILGDIPMYVGFDSSDVWSNQDCFLLQDGEPQFIAGVPPDYFSETGQRWGNPIYDWDQLQQRGFDFWIERLKYVAQMYDCIRIDHFRAFDTYWKISASCPTAIEGSWEEAPGYAFFDQLFKSYPKIQIVAEDLGNLRDEVFVLRDYYGFKGMKVIQFTYSLESGYDEFEDRENLIIYTGTHDNQTLQGWLDSAPLAITQKVNMRLKQSGYPYDNAVMNLIAYTMESVAEIAIILMQDVLELDDSARMNVPNQVNEINWVWKLADFDEFEKKIPILRKLIEDTKRDGGEV